MASKDPEAPTGSQPVEEEPHGAINPNEVAALVCSLEEAMTVLEAQIAETEERDILNELVTKFKEAISRVIPAMAESEIGKVVGSIKDLSCVAVRPKNRGARRTTVSNDATRRCTNRERSHGIYRRKITAGQESVGVDKGTL